MKKKVLCTVMAVTILLTQTASAAPWQLRRNQLIFDSEIEFIGNVTLQFASDGGSFIRPITKRYGESISLDKEALTGLFLLTLILIFLFSPLKKVSVRDKCWYA